MEPVSDDIEFVLDTIEIIFLEHDHKLLIITLSHKLGTRVSLN